MLRENKKIGVVLPTYNEEENIDELLHNIFSNSPNISVIVVDDSPNDKTALAAKEAISYLATSNTQLDYRVIKRVNAKGRASAVREGFKILANENFDYIIEMDTDGSHPPHQLSQLIDTALSENADIVICSRDLKDSKVIGWPVQRKLLHFLANFSCRLLLNLGIRDYMNAYRIYSSRATHVVLKEAGTISTGFWAFGESLLHVKVRGGKVMEIPTIFVNRTRGQSQVKLKTIIGCAKELLQVFRLWQQLRTKSLHF